MVIGTLMLFSCSQSSFEDEVKLADQAIADGNRKQAVIYLKNAIAKRPDDPSVRLKLGQIYLSSGASNQAEKEIIKARENGLSLEQIAPSLLEAYHYRGKYQDILDVRDDYKAEQLPDSAAVNFFTAIAYLATNDIATARSVLEQNANLFAGSDYGLSSRGLLHTMDKEFDDAIKLFDQALSQSEKFRTALSLKAQALQTKGDTSLAIEVFSLYLNEVPLDYRAKFMLASAYLREDKLVEADQLAEQLLEISAQSPLFNQLKSFISLESANYSAAREHSERAIQNGLDNAELRIIAGFSSYQQQNFEQAYNHLITIRDQLPTEHMARRLLAVVELELGYYEEAATELAQLTDLSNDDLTLLVKTSLDLISVGNRQAATPLVKVVQQLGDSVNIDPLLKGTLELAIGDVSGLKTFEDATFEGNASLVSKTTLAQAYLAQGDYEKAKALGQQIVEIKPSSGYSILAIAEARQGNEEQAEAYYIQLKEVDNNNPSANMYFANQSLTEEKYKEAIDILSQLAEAKPNYLPGLMLNYIAHKRNGDPEPAIQVIRKAMENATPPLSHAILLSRVLTLEKSFSEIIELLDVITPTRKTPDYFWIALGNSYFKTNQLEQANVVYKDWTDKRPQVKEAWIRRAQFHALSGDISNAIGTLLFARSYFENDPQLNLYLSQYYIDSGNWRAAQQSFDELPESLNAVPGYRSLQAQLLANKGNHAQAADLFAQAYAAIPTTDLLFKYTDTLSNLKRDSQIIQLFESHAEQFVNDVRSRIYLGNYYFQSAPLQASKYYQQVTDINPDHVLALNNLAWLLGQRGEYETALKYARMAATNAPNNTAVLDTFGYLLIENNQLQEALKVYSQIIALPNATNEMRATFRKLSDQAL